MAWIAVSFLIAIVSLCIFYFTPGFHGLRSQPLQKLQTRTVTRHAKNTMITPPESLEETPESPTTPKASAANSKLSAGPSLSLDEPRDGDPKPGQKGAASLSSASQLMPPPPAPPPKSPKRMSQNANGGLSSAGAAHSLPQRTASLRAPTTTMSQSSRTASLIPNPRAPPQRSSSVTAPTTSTLPAPKRPRQKVVLSPGHSPLDWAHLISSTPSQQLSGVPTLIRVTPSQLKAMNGRKGAPAWSAFGGKVYNIGPYLPFHPGGEGELKRGAGKVADQLFDEVHPWVNVDNMLKGCLVGLLVAESGKSGASELEEMD